MTITENSTVGDIAATVSSSIRVFEQLGIDYCCGGKQTIGAVCARRGLSLTDVTRAIEGAAPTSEISSRDWTQQPLHTLIEHIVSTYHVALRGELPRLQAMASKVAQVHGAKAPFLARIEHVVSELSSDLIAHMDKEERILFPAIRASETGSPANASWIASPVSIMEHEHDRAGEFLSELRTITGHYIPPAWGCATVRALYQGLEALETSMHEHVHLENNILFPRALKRTGASAVEG